MEKNGINVKAFLLHITHYDPAWMARKKTEKRFDLGVAKRLVDAMAEAGMNLLVIDCADGVIYESHPELKRRYSAPMKDLRSLCEHAHKSGIDVAPKLNFSKSGRNQHDLWMRPYADNVRWMIPYKKEYYPVAKDLIDELVEVCEPKEYFHIGMDEDHYRSLPQFVNAIKRLRKMVNSHGLRTVIWNDACHDDVKKLAQVHAKKCIDAEPLLPKDTVHVLWHYLKACPAHVKRLTDQGFSVWGAPGREPRLVKNWRRALVQHGGEGMMLTRWEKCDKDHEKELTELIKGCAPSM